MALRIATNVQALAAQRNLRINHDSQNQQLERMASGSRINRAGDDAAGLAISEKLRASIRSLKQATRNANDGVSLIQTAEGAMNEVSNILIRLRELSIQAASDTVGPGERAFVDKEVQHLKLEIDRIANATEYNGRNLLNGSSGLLDLQVGIFNDPVNDRFTYDAGAANVTLGALGMDGVSTIEKEDAQKNLAMLDNALFHVNENRASLGALQNRLGSTINNLEIYRENLESANARIRDTDMAEAATELVKFNILSQANIATLAQANQNPQLALKLINNV